MSKRNPYRKLMKSKGEKARKRLSRKSATWNVNRTKSIIRSEKKKTFLDKLWK